MAVMSPVTPGTEPTFLLQMQAISQMATLLTLPASQSSERRWSGCW